MTSKELREKRKCVFNKIVKPNGSDIQLISLIEKHNFFEGKGSPYRIEPKKLIEIIF